MSKICCPLTNQNLSSAREYDHVKNLELADVGEGSGEFPVGVFSWY